jgi:hypothetical protein
VKRRGRVGEKLFCKKVFPQSPFQKTPNNDKLDAVLTDGRRCRLAQSRASPDYFIRSKLSSTVEYGA